METTTLPSFPQMVHRASRYAADMLQRIVAGSDPYALGYSPANHPDQYELNEVLRKLREWGCVDATRSAVGQSVLAPGVVWSITDRGSELLDRLTP